MQNEHDFSLLSKGQCIKVFQSLARFSGLEKMQAFQKLISRKMFTLFQMSCLNMLCLRQEEANKRSSRLLREEDEDIQNRVSDEENEEGSQ